jgi:hypothetical protein
MEGIGRENNKGKCQKVGEHTSQYTSTSSKSFWTLHYLKPTSEAAWSLMHTVLWYLSHVPKTRPQSSCKMPSIFCLSGLSFAGLLTQSCLIHLKISSSGRLSSNITPSVKHSLILLDNIILWSKSLSACLMLCFLNTLINKWRNVIMYSIFRKWSLWDNWGIVYLRTQQAGSILQAKEFDLILYRRVTREFWIHLQIPTIVL